MPDAEMESAVDGVALVRLPRAGQRCLANSVCVAVGDAYEPLKKRLVEKGDAMIVGEGIEPETEVGPVISAAARERIGEFIDRGLAEGGELVLDGRGKGLRRRPLRRPDDHRDRSGLGDRHGGDLRAGPQRSSERATLDQAIE